MAEALSKLRAKFYDGADRYLVVNLASMSAKRFARDGQSDGGTGTERSAMVF